MIIDSVYLNTYLEKLNVDNWREGLSMQNPKAEKLLLKAQGKNLRSRNPGGV